MFQGPATNGAVISGLLSETTSRWAEYFPLRANLDLSAIGVSYGNGVYSMAGNARNIYGLPYLSAMLAYNNGSGLQLALLNAGGSVAVPTTGGYIYPEAAQPQLQTVDYYFTQVPLDFPHHPALTPMPGQAEFSVTNTSPVLMAAFGDPYFKIAACAKQQIANGYAGRYAYLGQYFDKAYTMDANGVATTNEAGVLSAYGNFFPTQPGPAALVTMSDIDTGERGTGVVHVVKLQLDVNHDGAMDLSFAGPDNTSSARPFVFWVNNDCDEPATSTKSDRDLESYQDKPSTQDWFHGHMRCARNMEDFARLWVCGLPALPDTQGYTVTLSLVASTGTPAINLYRAYDSSGGMGYLTNMTAATNQLTRQYLNGQLKFDYGAKLQTIDSIRSYTLPMSVTTGVPLFSHFLFEGAGKGSGQLVLTVYQGSNVIAQTSAWLDLRDVKELYEIVAVSNVQQGWPEMVEENRTSGFQIIHSPDASLMNSREQMAVFVHGWRMPEWDYFNFSETMFKRLYWQGFQGRFAALRWPTRSATSDPFLGLDFATYNRSEHIAFKSATGAAAYFNNLRTRFPNYTISACAHSMGNIVMMETLKQFAAANQSPLDNYVLMEAAVPAQCYDTAVTNFPLFIEREQAVPTPDVYRNYAAGISGALRGSMVNFFNPDDFALGTWMVNQSFYIPDTDGAITMKPNTFLGYYTDGSNHLLRTNSWNQDIRSILYGGYYDGPTRSVTNLYEIMPFISRPRTLAVGAQGGVQGEISAELDLKTQLGFTRETYDHSGQFNRNIQELQIWPFYLQLRNNLFPQAAP